MNIEVWLEDRYMYNFQKADNKIAVETAQMRRLICAFVVTNHRIQFLDYKKIIIHYKKIGYNINVFQQTACLVVNPITVGNFAFLFNCMQVGPTLDSMMVPT